MELGWGEKGLSLNGGMEMMKVNFVAHINRGESGVKQNHKTFYKKVLNVLLNLLNVYGLFFGKGMYDFQIKIKKNTGYI